MLEEIIDDVRQQMEKAIEVLRRDLAGLRTGRATASLLDGIRIDYYGTPTPLNQLASVSVPEPRMLTVKPYEQSLIAEIEKMIRSEPSLGLNPSNDGTLIRLPIPELTEERRHDLVKVGRQRAEEVDERHRRPFQPAPRRQRRSHREPGAPHRARLPRHRERSSPGLSEGRYPAHVVRRAASVRAIPARR